MKKRLLANPTFLFKILVLYFKVTIFLFFLGLSLSLQPSNEDYFISNNGYNPPKPSIFNLKKPKPPKATKVTHTVYDIKDIKDDKLAPGGILIGKKCPKNRTSSHLKVNTLIVPRNFLPSILIFFFNSPDRILS